MSFPVSTGPPDSAYYTAEVHARYAFMHEGAASGDPLLPDDRLLASLGEDHVLHAGVIRTTLFAFPAELMGAYAGGSSGN